MQIVTTFCVSKTCACPKHADCDKAKKPTANTPVTVTPETRAACFVSPVPAGHLGGGVSGYTENQMRLAASP